MIFKDAQFQIENGAKVGLIGPNGCGKSTLLKMIVNQELPIKTAPNIRIGYFSQEMSILDGTKSILDNVMVESIYEERFVRLLLARLLFKGDSVQKVGILSGGEKVKASLQKSYVATLTYLSLTNLRTTGSILWKWWRKS